jgi:hypothetical protein
MCKQKYADGQQSFDMEEVACKRKQQCHTFMMKNIVTYRSGSVTENISEHTDIRREE